MSSKATNGEAPEQDSPNHDPPQNGQQTQNPPAAESPSGETEDPSVSSKIMQLLKTPDSIILSFNSLLSSSGDLYAVLSTFSYTLGLLALFYIKARHWTHRLRTGNHVHKEAAGGSIAALAKLFWRARLTLRLFGLLPLYARARHIIYGSDRKKDGVLFVTTLLQCILFGASQLLENVAFLTDSKIISKSLTSRWTSVDSTIPIYTTAYRAWFLAVSCDIVSSFRKMQLIGQRDEKRDSAGEGEQQSQGTWWLSNSVLQLAWFPIGWQFSSWTEDAIPGFNIGLHSAACVLSDLEKTVRLWGKSSNA
ncbi:hypothetical protein F5Y14DRAFT_465893 [Nemania sp. NC0429]|nr:hypothetical protein F5Y14DRAFT_465893 [Nemania sp. NC0429]